MPEHANAIKASKSPPILILGHPGKSVTFLSKLDNNYRRQPVVSRHSTKLQYHLSPVLPVLPLSNLFNISILIFSAFPKVSSYLLLLSYIPPPSPAITFHSTDSSIHKMVDNVDGEETTTHENEWEVPKTSDNEEGGEAVPRGNEWEVVSLTASAYAASPGPRGDVTIHEEKALMLGEDYEAESSRALFMSGHFVFPPSQHENLPIEPESLVISKGLEEDESAGERNVANDSKDEQKEVENWNIEGLNMPEEFPGISFFEEKANKMLSFHGPGFDKSATLHQLDVDDKEPKVYGTAKFSPFLSETEIGGPAAFVESVLSDYDESSDHGLDPSSLISKPTKFGDEDEFDDSELPCGAWWKRRVVSLCAHVKDTNAFWSIFVAAAVMGLVILGQRWQQERWVVLQQRWQLSVGNEKSGRILSRLKDVIVGGSRRNTYITAASADR